MIDFNIKSDFRFGERLQVFNKLVVKVETRL